MGSSTLATRPFAYEKAEISEYSEKSEDDTPVQNLCIQGFDVDEALRLLREDFDRILEPSNVAAIWAAGGSPAGVLDDLVALKEEWAEVSTERLKKILVDEQELDKSPLRAKIKKHISNTIKKKISNIHTIDTIAAARVSYTDLDVHGTFYLYGRLKNSSDKRQNLNGRDKEEKTVEGNRFLPVALERTGGTGHLVVQVDAKQEGATEILKFWPTYEVTHVLWKKSDTDRELWLTINHGNIANESGYENRLHSDEKGWEIPILYKKLVKRPAIDIQSGDDREIRLNRRRNPKFLGHQMIQDLRKWEFSTILKREQAVLQDDVHLDLEFNRSPFGDPEEVNPLISAQRDRPFQVALYEYMYNIRRGGSEEKDKVKLSPERTAYLIRNWVREICGALKDIGNAPALFVRKVPLRTHHYNLKEDGDQNNPVKKRMVTLDGREVWSDKGLKHEIFDWKDESPGSTQPQKIQR